MFSAKAVAITDGGQTRAARMYIGIEEALDEVAQPAVVREEREDVVRDPDRDVDPRRPHEVEEVGMPPEKLVAVKSRP